VINALLGWYAARFETEEISFDADVALPDDVAADPDELCVLFGNLLENALEGCLTANGERFVKISAKTSGTELAVVIVNSFDGVVRRDETRDENLLSRKENGGMGIQSISAVCKKYGGVYIPSWTHDRFTAHALLNLREDAA
jgi:sensor histidine kinase YesM